jgi:predicted enzyme related to lactoylglutathione lyase
MYSKQLGEMAWMDLSVLNAKAVSEFYQAVLGWEVEPVNMTDNNESYQDFVMTSVSTTTKDEKTENSDSSPSTLMTGICHARGDNQDMPAVWLPYFLVNDLDESILKVTNNGGALETKIKNIGADRYVVIKDPAGAMVAIYQKG